MSLSIGIVGLPNVGKSSLFKALTREKIEIAKYPFTTIKENLGIVKLPDDRLFKVAQKAEIQEIIPQTVEFIDIAGLIKGAHKGLGLGNKFLAKIRETAVICQVVRCFEAPDIPHSEDGPNPLRDIEIINLELALADLEMIENILENLGKKISRREEEANYQLSALKKIKRTLEEGRSFAEIIFEEKEKKAINSFSFLTQKPMLLILNTDEKIITDQTKQKELINKILNSLRLPVKSEFILPASLKIEAELAEMKPEEIELYKKELGLNEEILKKIIKKSWELLKLITFFTIKGKSQCRAWAIEKENTAWEAAGKVHSDFQKKFRGAEVIFWEEFLKIGSWEKAHQLGKIRLEGKEYNIKDGEIVEFLHY